MRDFINKHCLVECDEGTGTAGERLFEPYTQCSGDCKVMFPDFDLTESKTIGGKFCQDCWEIEEARHIHSRDYDGSPFN